MQVPHRDQFSRFMGVEISADMLKILDRVADRRAIVIRDIDMASRKIACDNEKAGWYCLAVRSRSEFAVEKRLDEADVHVLVPRRQGKAQRHRGRVVVSDQPVMLGYVLVRVVPGIEAFNGLRRVDGVTGVLGGLQHPFRVRDVEVRKFSELAQQGAYDWQAFEGRFDVYEEVRVVDGPFASFHAVVTAVDYEQGRVRVEVNIFGRSTPVELTLAQIEKL